MPHYLTLSPPNSTNNCIIVSDRKKYKSFMFGEDLTKMTRE